jgi:hypothetical protein
MDSSKTNQRAIFVLVLSMMLAICGGYVWVVTHTQTLRMGGMVTSPGGKYTAGLSSCIIQRPFCATQYYYELYVIDERASTRHRDQIVGQRSVRVVVKESTDLRIVRGSPPFPITWNSDATRCTCDIDGIKMELTVP